MADVDSNGVDILDRFLAYKSRFVQFGMTQQVYFDVILYIERLRAERDEARRECCTWQGLESGKSKQDVATSRGWDCFKRQGSQEAMNRLAELDEELGLI